MVVARALGVLLLVNACPPAAVAGDPPSATQLIDAAIRYHDPEDRWFHTTNTLVVSETRPGGRAGSRVTLTLHPAPGRFDVTIEKEGDRVSGALDGANCTTSPAALSEAQKRVFRDFDCEQVRWLHRYYGYLFNAPMNLRDEGARIDSEVTEESFAGRDAYRVTVRYGPEDPVWEYFVDPESGALLGCRFSKDGKREDGERIVYEGEVEAAGIRLPKERSWYLHSDGSLIGVDTIDRLTCE